MHKLCSNIKGLVSDCIENLTIITVFHWRQTGGLSLRTVWSLAGLHEIGRVDVYETHLAFCGPIPSITFRHFSEGSDLQIDRKLQKLLPLETRWKRKHIKVKNASLNKTNKLVRKVEGFCGISEAELLSHLSAEHIWKCKLSFCFLLFISVLKSFSLFHFRQTWN